MTWPSTNGNYLSLEDASPQSALTMAYAYRSDLMGAMVGAVDVDGASINTSSLPAVVAIVDKDIERLRMKAYRSGVPRMVPVIRVDPLGQNRSGIVS
jgi:hypothetical protein